MIDIGAAQPSFLYTTVCGYVALCLPWGFSCLIFPATSSRTRSHPIGCLYYNDRSTDCQDRISGDCTHLALSAPATRSPGQQSARSCKPARLWLLRQNGPASTKPARCLSQAGG